MYQKNTKIVCTLGPSTDSVTEIEQLVSAGMNVARLNFSHGTYENHSKILKSLHTVEKKMKKRIGVMQDLQGPKIRVGEMPEEGIQIKKGQEVEFTIQKTKGKTDGKKTLIPIQYKGITKDLKKKDSMYIDDGLMLVEVLKKSKTSLFCKVKIGGTVYSRKGINCPTASISASPITAKDKNDLEFGLKNNVDYIALSFVKSKRDIDALRKMIKAKRKSTKIIAKIERHEAVKNLREIIKAADGVMVARGDLGIEIPAEKVPIVQKLIIKLARKYGKPVITATQVLQSMVENARATRAEISDAANAVFDSTDAIMLSNESAVGRYPFKAARTLTKVSMEVEKEIQKHPELYEGDTPAIISTLCGTCLNASEMARDIKADAIIVYSEDGYTARHIVRNRLFTPIITVTPEEKTAQELTLVWGINQVYVKKIAKNKDKISQILKYLKQVKAVKKNQKVVIVCHASKKDSLISTTKIK